MKRPDWDELYITMCYLVGMRSKDPHTHVGAVIVDSENVLVSTGYNSLPRGIDIDENLYRISRENGEKYYWLEHAERNAIYNAARRGTTLKECKIYIPWIPCTDCARAIIQTGLSEVIIHKNGQDFYDKNTNGKWTASYNKTTTMFKEASIKMRYLTCNIVAPEIFMNAKLFDAMVFLNSKNNEEAK